MESLRPQRGVQDTTSHGGDAGAGSAAPRRVPRRDDGSFTPRRSKLRPSRSAVALVMRERVVSRLLGAREPVVLLCAAAGSGKTVAAMQWAARERRPVAWLRLDSRDNDPVVFLSYLALALDVAAAAHTGSSGLLRRRQAPRRDQLLARIVAAVGAAPPFALFLDDCHQVRNRDCWDDVGVLLEELPEGASLVLGTRAEPPLPFGRLRAEGRLCEVRQARFAFDLDETRELLRLHGLEADEGVVAALAERTEGWAAGTYLALLAVRGRPQADWLAETRGDQDGISAFLLDEVLRTLPPELQLFLEQTSILDELSAPLCAAVTGHEDAGAALERLARDNLFVSALDDHGERYRYQHLLTDLLRCRLERRGCAEAARLHRRAAAWYRDHEQPESAVRHYLAAGDVDATVELAARTADTLLLQGYAESARRLLRLYTTEQLLAHPALAIAAGWVFALSAGTADEQRRWARLMRTFEFEDGPSPLGAASLRSSYLFIVAELAPEGVTQARRCLEEALRLETRPGVWRDLAQDRLARTHYLAGATDRARRLYREIMAAEPGMLGAPDRDRMASTRCWLALIAEDMGCWDEASALAAECGRLCPQTGLDAPIHLCAFLPALYVRLRLMAHAGDPETMAFARSIDVFTAEMVHNAPWVLLMRDVVLGEVALEQGDLAAAQHWCDRALNTLAGWADAGVFGRRARRLADRLERRLCAEPLSVAERRVLGEMPSCLTMGEIAAALHLSRNTVKSHCTAIYRKLEVSSRSAAVSKARTLGLL